jgi:5-formyltetrahydrofolate cyclo-ligase
VVNAVKRLLRARMRAARRSLPAEQRIRESAAAAACCDILLGQGNPASYVAMADEIDLGDLHARRWADSRPVLLPRVIGEGRLSWHAVLDAESLVVGSYGIREPDPNRWPAIELPHGTTILVPGLAFTRDGHRLGQGGGFYDRLLEGRPDLRTIGVGFACQLVEEIPSAPHDRRLDCLVIAGEVVLTPSPT